MELLIDVSKLEQIETDATIQDISKISIFLQENLGQKISAYISGIKDAKLVGKWSTGKVTPKDLTQMKLRRAYHAVRIIVEQYGSSTAKAWLFGSNTRLDNKAPGHLLRHVKTFDSLPDIVPVAKSFAGFVD